MKIFRSFRLGAYCAILAWIVLAQFSAKSNEVGASAKHPHTLTGNIRLHQNFQSRFLKNSRDIIVYLPPGYNSSRRRYPVLYMQDGQNLFDEATSFFFNKERHMDEQAQDLITHHEIEPLIIVGIYSAGFDRINEFTPALRPGSNLGGRADLYGRMLVEEVKPFIDKQYRTLTDRSHTGLGGSSLGGLVTVYLGLKYSSIFGILSATSPAAYWDNEMIVRYVQALASKTHQRVCLSVGTDEPDLFLDTTRALREAFVKKGWKEGKDLGYLEASGLEHAPDERGTRANYLLKYLFPARRSH